MKLKFFIIGSCYCGYMFKEKLLGALANGNLEMIYQHQHDSFISMMTKPVDVSLEGATSKYQWDFDHFAAAVFKKDILQKIADMKPDYLVFDTYADAMCPIIKIDADTYVTNNYYISTSSVSEALREKEILDAGNPERERMFGRYVKEFFAAVRAILPEIKLILVRTKGAEELYNPDTGERSIFPYAPRVEQVNLRREKYDRYIMEQIENVSCLTMSDMCIPADTRIRDDYHYEISHNHYAVEYYRKEYIRLQNIVIADLLGGKERTRYFRQAICIAAVDDFPLLLLLVKIYKDFFRVYVHIDENAIGSTFTEDQIERLREVPNVSVLTKYKCPKGSYNELLAWQEMFSMAFRDEAVEYVHYMTGHDMPIRPVNEIYQFFEREENKYSYLNLHANGSREEMRKMASYTYGQYYYMYNADESDPGVKEMMDESVRWQRNHGVERNSLGEFRELYKGVVGGSFTREAFTYCQEYVENHPEYMEDIRFTRLRAEFFYHTILLNTPQFREKIKKGLRGGKHAWLWDEERKDYADLSLPDYKKLRENAETFWVRDIRSGKKDVVEAILKDIKSPYQLEY